MKYEVDIDLSEPTSHSIILRRIAPHTKVLEFGPAAGYMTKYMKEVLNCSVYCVEIDEEAARAAEKYAEKMIVADIDSMVWIQELEGENFDYIIFADVLEHLRSPKKVLKSATSMLKPTGNILISVPNITHNAIIMDMLQGKFDYRPTGLLDETHIHFFTRRHLVEVLEYAGLKPLEILVTQRRPETTEFKQDYRYFPDPIRSYLRSRPDGHVYQYIAVAEIGRIEDSDQVYDHICDNYLDANYIQVYWGKEGRFAELNSVRTPIQMGMRKKYELCLPKEATGRLRLDLANTIVRGELYKIALRNTRTQDLIYHWEPGSNERLFSSIEMLILSKQDSLDFICLKSECSLLLENFEVEDNNGDLILELEMYVEDNPEKVIEYIYNMLIAERHNFSRKIENQEKDYRDIERKLAQSELELQLYKEQNRELLNLAEKVRQEQKDAFVLFMNQTRELLGAIERISENKKNELSDLLVRITDQNREMLGLQKQVLHDVSELPNKLSSKLSASFEQVERTIIQATTSKLVKLARKLFKRGLT